jgi:hypothetical protein
MGWIEVPRPFHPIKNAAAFRRLFDEHAALFVNFFPARGRKVKEVNFTNPLIGIVELEPLTREVKTPRFQG